MSSPEDIIQLLTEFYSPNITQDRFKDIDNYLLQFRSNPSTFTTALEILSNYTYKPAIWYACSIIDEVVLNYWVPRSLQPDPSKSELSKETKLQIREFFKQFIMTKLGDMEEDAGNFVFSSIARLMKVDFNNEGLYWLKFATDNLHSSELLFASLKIIRFFSEEIQSPIDHSIATQTRLFLRNQINTVVPEITRMVVEILASTQTIDESTVEAFVLLKSFVHWMSSSFISPQLIQVLVAYGHASMGEISIEAHKCIQTLFARYDVYIHTSFRSEFLHLFFEFFNTELSLLGTETSDTLTVSLISALQPFALNYLFKQDEFDDSVIFEFLYSLDEITWRLLGTPHFCLMIEIWFELFAGTSAIQGQKKYKPPFFQMVEKCVDAMINVELMPLLSEDDYFILIDFIETVSDFYTEDICRLVQRAVTICVNGNLQSITPMLTLFLYVIGLLENDDPGIPSISDSLIRYINLLMTMNCPVDVSEVFTNVQKIIKQYVRQFSRNSDFFLEKVFHLVTVSLNCGPDFVEPMIDLLLETLKVYRPMKPCKTLFSKLMELHQQFLELPPNIYSLYICCLEQIAACNPTDGGKKPLYPAPIVGKIFEVMFSNLHSPEHLPIVLTLLHDAMLNISFSFQPTKELVFSAFVPYIDDILSIYETGLDAPVIGPFLDFIDAFCMIFPNQIAERMSEFINRLLSPLEAVIPCLADGSFEHYATKSFLTILLKLSNTRTTAAGNQTMIVVQFLMKYGNSLLQGSPDVVFLIIQIITALIEFRWELLDHDMQSSLLRVIFFEGICEPDFESVDKSVEAIKKAQFHHHVFNHMDPTFRFKAFSIVCREMCLCAHTSLRPTMSDLTVYFCQCTPNFLEELLLPFIDLIPIDNNEKQIIAPYFENYSDISEFRSRFGDFCDDIAYLLSGKMELLTEAIESILV